MVILVMTFERLKLAFSVEVLALTPRMKDEINCFLMLEGQAADHQIDKLHGF